VSDNFGNSVAVSGDTVVVGAIFEDSNATGAGGNQADNSASSSGAAYVFVRSGTGGAWTQQAYLKASNTDAGGGDHFGNSVAVSGDTVVVGANTEDSNAVGVIGNQADNSALDSGAGYIFTLTLDLCAGQQPTITQHPSSQSAVATWTLGFTAAATSPSGSSLSYQWQRNGLDLADGGNIAGATTPTLTISPAALTDNGGAYACIVTNSCGSTSTRPAGLAVTTAPHCIADLGSQGGIPGADGFLDNNDFVIFIDAFFNHTGCP
jgi:hypothetical protein